MSFITSRSRHRCEDRVWGYVPVADWNGPLRRRFVVYFHFVGWDCLSLGVHISVIHPNVEIHVPLGFIRVGWQMRP